ncbi:hypothetical protein [Lysobacter gummosus]|uniref:hypothetical protein n=1 Tax=Lysobacter gummosus TaxID=262324 RepID=UPI00363C6FC9
MEFFDAPRSSYSSLLTSRFVSSLRNSQFALHAIHSALRILTYRHSRERGNPVSLP